MAHNLLVTLADKNYLDFAKQLFSSAYFNSGWSGDYMLLAHEIPDEDLKWFKDKGIIIRKCQPIDGVDTGRWPKTILSKLYLFTTDFKKWQKIIYLDADLIIEAPLDNILKVKKIAGLRNYHHCPLKLKDYFLNHKNKTEIKEFKKNYQLNKYVYSSIVMVFDSKIIHNETFYNLLKIIKNNHYHISLGPDEKALNLLFSGDWQQLPMIYGINLEIMENLNISKLTGAIINFHFYNKPLDHFNYFYQRWKKNLNLADEINLNYRLTGQKKINRWLAIKYDFYRHLNTLSGRFKYSINIKIGILGLIIKKYFPKIYSVYKKIN